MIQLKATPGRGTRALVHVLNLVIPLRIFADIMHQRGRLGIFLCLFSDEHDARFVDSSLHLRHRPRPRDGARARTVLRIQRNTAAMTQDIPSTNN